MKHYSVNVFQSGRRLRTAALLAMGFLGLFGLAACGNSDSKIESSAAADQAEVVLPPAPDSEASAALQHLMKTVADTQEKFVSPQMGVTDTYTAGEANRLIAHMLHTGLEFWLEANPSRPEFKRYVTTNRKLLGDNPDSIYYFAAIDDDQTYIVRGNIGAAVFTSFTVEGGSQNGNAATSSISALGDHDMVIAPDGSYEITVSRKKPKSGNWLKLEEGAGQITTRHYHETRLSIAADRSVEMDISIEAIDPKPLKPYGGDAEVAAKLHQVANFIAGHAPMGMTPTSPAMAEAFGWISLEPNVIAKPGQFISAGKQAYANTHAYYSSGPYQLADDEALVIEGRFPAARFANVVLWNRYMQSNDFTQRQVSLNRQQISYEEDGSFRLVVAHKDPGIPNWLDTEGRTTGQIYWRWVFPQTDPEAPVAKVVKFKSLK
ncbi:MAG: DUF1214 domain-containing protein [Pseudomonadales bacterium]